MGKLIVQSNTANRNSLWGLRVCVTFIESKNGLLILDLSDFAVQRNVKSEIRFVTLVTFRKRKRVQYAWQPLKKWRLFYRLTNYAIIPCIILWSAVRIATMEHNEERRAFKAKNYLKVVGSIWSSFVPRISNPMNPFLKRIHQIKHPDLDSPKGTRNPV